LSLHDQQIHQKARVFEAKRDPPVLSILIGRFAFNNSAASAINNWACPDNHSSIHYAGSALTDQPASGGRRQDLVPPGGIAVKKQATLFHQHF